MNVTLLIKALESGQVEASVLQLPAYRVEAKSRELAIATLQTILLEKLQDAEALAWEIPVQKSQQSLAWLKFAGIFSLWLRDHPVVKAKVSEFGQDVFVTIITVQELFKGWIGRLNNTTDAALRLDRYENFWQTVDFIRQVPVLKFDAASDTEYVRILRENVALRKKRLHQDLRIALNV